ncbi:MAG: YidH family protein [Bacteroidota bacterium]
MLKSEEKNLIERSREHLANERTFLAWIRTSIGLMGFGFVIVKFTLFLQHIYLLLEIKEEITRNYSSAVGIVMVALGVVISILSLIQYKINEKQLKQNFYTRSTNLSLSMTLMIIAGGILMVLYLLSNIDVV